MTLMTEAGLIRAFKTEVAPIGQFDTLYPDVTTAQIAGLLADSFAAGQLWGFFPTYELDPDVLEVSPDLTPKEAQLVIVLAGIQQLRVRVAMADNKNVYTAGPTTYEREQSATIVVQLLKSAEDRFNRLLKNLVEDGLIDTGVYTIDAYAARVLNDGAGVYVALGGLP